MRTQQEILNQILSVGVAGLITVSLNTTAYLTEVLRGGIEALNKGGRLCIITFHSLEDRIVKQMFKKYTTLDIPKGLPYIPDYMKLEYKLVNSKVILPSEEELLENNRSHSAKMRGIEKL